MKCDIKVCGWEIHLEKKPMEKERFEKLCHLAFAMIAAMAFVKFVSILA